VSRAAGGRPAYHPATLLKIYIYGYLSRIKFSRRWNLAESRQLLNLWLTQL
jgi:transposase